MANKTNEQIAMHVSRVSIAGNLLLSLFKLVAGLLAHSGAMISDAIHSASDVISTIIVMVGIRMSNKASDRDHQYGHERMECVAAILLSIALGATGLGIGASGLNKILSAAEIPLTVPGRLALAAAVISILSKELMYQYTRFAAKRIRSSALLADAWHHRSDALSSIGSFIGIFGARLGFPVLDPLASIVICLFIIKAAYDIFRDAISKMTDRAADEKTAHRILEVCAVQEDVVAVDSVKTRLFGDRIYVDVEIAVDGSMPLRQAHAAAERTHDAIEKQFPAVKHCMVHVNPAPTLTEEDDEYLL
ncbi:MAG: cation diffusion facilitator family transporter [Eubacteriales bacterium]|nr:cation diffusion facilitator family transporter [Eubacteriales bacterium]